MSTSATLQAATFCLYLVPAPTGHPDDIGLRALRVLREAAVVACFAEEAAQAALFLAHHGIQRQATVLPPEAVTAQRLILSALQTSDAALLGAHADLVFVSRLIDQGVKVVPLPGASAIITALVASGLPTDSYCYLGEMPADADHDRAARWFAPYAAESRTLILRLDPRRWPDQLAALAACILARPAVLTLDPGSCSHRTQRGTLADLVQAAGQRLPSREAILILSGAPLAEPVVWDKPRLIATLRAYLDAGLSRREAARRVAEESGWARRAVYDLSLEMGFPGTEG